MKRLVHFLIYLIGFPAMGVLFGFVFFKVFDIVNGPLDDLAFWISVIGWGGFGVLAGFYGIYFYIKIERLRKLNPNISKSHEPKP